MQDKLKVDFTSRKKELDKLIMEAVNAMNSSESSAESEEEVKPKKRKADSSEESDYKPSKSTKKRKGSSDEEEDWKESKKKKAGPKPKYTGFTRPYKLSPDLASLMGAKEMPRHEVVKKVWAIIKEKNLYDPKNKQYAICDQGNSH
jgi:upstream activation factor subunit UAF30